MHLLRGGSVSVSFSFGCSLYVEENGKEKRKKDHPLLIQRIPLFQLLQHTDFDLTRVAVLGDGADDLDCDSGLRGGVDGFDDFAECALAEETDGSVWEVGVLVLVLYWC